MSSDLDPEVLELCGYVKVHTILVGDGQSVSFSLTKGWARVTLTTTDLGGEGSALGLTKKVTFWAMGEGSIDVPWRYDITVQHEAGEVSVMAMKLQGSSGSDDQYGDLVALDPPTPMEMLAAQAQAVN
jgi:hypothetical protein